MKTNIFSIQSGFQFRFAKLKMKRTREQDVPFYLAVKNLSNTTFLVQVNTGIKTIGAYHVPFSTKTTSDLFSIYYAENDTITLTIVGDNAHFTTMTENTAYETISMERALFEPLFLVFGEERILLFSSKLY